MSPTLSLVQHQSGSVFLTIKLPGEEHQAVIATLAFDGQYPPNVVADHRKVIMEIIRDFNAKHAATQKDNVVAFTQMKGDRNAS